MKVSGFNYFSGLYLMLSLMACGGAQQQQLRKKEEVVKLAYEHQDYRTAIAYTYELYVNDYNKVYLLDSLFYLYMYTGEYIPAVKISDKLIDNRMENVRFVYSAAIAYEQTGNYEMAVNTYKKALELGVKDSLQATYNLAKCYLEMGMYNESVQQAEHVLAMEAAKETILYIKDDKVTYDVAALNLIAMNYIRQKNYAEAREILTVVMKIAPFFRSAENNLAKLNLLMYGR